MRRRRSRRSWFRRLFRKQPRQAEWVSISPELQRDISSPSDDSQTLSDVRYPRRRRRSFWRRLFSGSRKKRKPRPLPSLKPRLPEETATRKWGSGKLLIAAINSTILYLLAFVGVYLIYQMSVIFIASFFDISGVLYYHSVFWPIGNSSPDWFPYYRIVLITGSGPFVSLIIGLIFYRIFAHNARKPAVKLLFIWIGLHALNMFFGAFMAGVTTSDGFGYVPSWLHMNIVFRIFFSIVFLAALAGFGYYATRYFIETSPSPEYFKHEKRRVFLIYRALIPCIAGSIILILIRMPVNPPYQVLMGFTMLAATVPVLFNFKAKPEKIRSFPKNKGKGIYFWYSLLLAIVLVLFRWGLSYGLHFFIDFSFSVTVFGH